MNFVLQFCEMKRFSASLVMPIACMVAHAELLDLQEEVAQWTALVAEVQQAIREYDYMYYIVLDDDGRELKRVMMDDALSQEVAQLLVPLQVASKFTDDEEYPQVVLVMISMEGKETKLVLTHIHAHGEDAYNCSLPDGEFGHLAWWLMEITEDLEWSPMEITEE